MLAGPRVLLLPCCLEFSLPFGFLGFHSHLLLPGLPLNPLSSEVHSPGFRGICMNTDHQGIASLLSDLQLSIQELSAKVDRLAARVEEIENQRGQTEPAPAPRQHSPTARSSVSLGQSSSSIFDSLATEIPAVPSWATELCSSLGGSQLSKEARASRAWEAGYWARFCVQGRINKCRPTKPIDLPNKFYVVLKAPNFECPLLCETAGNYRAVVGDFQGTVSHGFPSKSEARIYCAAAGVALPSSSYQWRP